MDKPISELQEELKLLKQEFQSRISRLELKLKILQSGDDKSYAQSSVTTDTSLQAGSEPQVVAEHNLPSHPKTPVENSVKMPPKVQEPHWVMLFLGTIFESVIDWLAPIKTLYLSYKARGMVGIFLLTLAGIGLTMAGFGYLMQLLIGQLDAGAKSLLMALFALLVLATGIVLKIKTSLGEFATAIVTLGVLLLYSTVYFAGSVYGLLPALVMVVLYLSIAISCHGLAIWMETKVVAALGVLGIASMPILSDVSAQETFFYLLSLTFVSASSLWIAYRAHWNWLAHFCLATFALSVEWLIGVNNQTLSIWSVESYYLMFTLYAFWTTWREPSPSRHNLVVMSASLGSSILLFYQLNQMSGVLLSTVFLMNSIVAASISAILHRFVHPARAFWILLTAVWTVLAIVELLSQAYWGIAWAVEGLLLFWIGRLFLDRLVLHQGQILMTLSLIYCLFAVLPYFPNPALKSMDGWIICLAIVSVLALWLRLIPSKMDGISITLGKVKPALQWTEAAWISAIILGCGIVWLAEWTGAIVILLQAALLARGRSTRLPAIDYFAASLIIVPIICGILGGLEANSFHFSDLPWYARASVISIMLQLWLWSAFYRRFHVHSPLLHIAEGARILFYLILPVCWVSSAFRHLQEDAFAILWLSPVIAFFIQRLVKHSLLKLELSVLTASTGVAMVVAQSSLGFFSGLASLLGFVAFWTLTHKLADDQSNIPHRLIERVGILSLGMALPLFVAVQSNNDVLGFEVAALYWSLCLLCSAKFSALEDNSNLIVGALSIILLLSWLWIGTQPLYIFSAVTVLIAIVITKLRFNPNFWLLNGVNSPNSIVLHSLVAVTYSLSLLAFDSLRLDLLIAPFLVVHGAMILVFKERQAQTVKYAFTLTFLGIVKLALIDAASAVLWQKVLLFIGIGLLMLVASFWYQRTIAQAVSVQSER